jgi:hypothetical protein
VLEGVYDIVRFIDSLFYLEYLYQKRSFNVKKDVEFVFGKLYLYGVSSKATTHFIEAKKTSYY